MRAIWLGLVALGVVVVAGFGFVTLFESRTKEVEQRFTGEARTNPLLAAVRVLRRMGIDAQTVRGVEATALAALAHDDVIVALEVPINDLPRVAGQFEPWINQGGRLVIGLAGQALEGGADSEHSGEENPARGRSGASPGNPTSHPPRWQGAWRRLGRGLAVGRSGKSPIREETVTLPGLSGRDDGLLSGGANPGPNRGDDRIRVSIRSRYYLDAQAPWQLRGRCLADRGHGRGRIIVFCASSQWMNRELGTLDHAALLWHLSGPPPLGSVQMAAQSSVSGLANDRRGRGRVWLVLGVDYPGFFAWLWARVPYGLVGGAMLLLAWLWTLVPRFGPRWEMPERQRRNVIENVEASARFQWRQGATQTLLAPMVEEVERRAVRHYPNFRCFDATERARVLVELAGAPGAQVSKLLGENRQVGPGSQRAKVGELVHSVRALERVRRCL